MTGHDATKNLYMYICEAITKWETVCVCVAAACYSTCSLTRFVSSSFPICWLCLQAIKSLPVLLADTFLWCSTSLLQEGIYLSDSHPQPGGVNTIILMRQSQWAWWEIRARLSVPPHVFSSPSDEANEGEQSRKWPDATPSSKKEIRCTEAALYLGYDDFFAEYFHGIVHSRGPLFDKNYLPERPLPKKF